MSTFTFGTLCEYFENIFKLKEKNKKIQELQKLLENYRNLVSKIQNFENVLLFLHFFLL